MVTTSWQRREMSVRALTGYAVGVSLCETPQLHIIDHIADDIAVLSLKETMKVRVKRSALTT
jgi:hypothetical protein